MKILYHHRTRSKDGQNEHIEEMIAALRSLGHEVIVVAPASTEKAEFGDEGGLVGGADVRYFFAEGACAGRLKLRSANFCTDFQMRKTP